MRILIATSRFNDFAGSEITVFEYAQELSYQGHEVSIASFSVSDTYSSACKKKGITVSFIDNEIFLNTSWDIIWVLHAVTYYALFSKYQYKTKKVIFSSLSHYEPLESPPIENKHIDLFTTNSHENLNYFKESYPVYSSRVIVLPNSIPRSFLNIPNESTKEKKLIIVSNHVPEELIILADLLRKNAWVVDIYGIGYKHKLITPEDLVKYSACITIGKTVQYCLSLKIPVFCYDRFGGPGWITKCNIDIAGEFNFSGRCTNEKRDVESLLKLFNDDKIPHYQECSQLSIMAKERFSLPNNISKTLNCLDSTAEVDRPLDVTVRHVLQKIVDMYLRDQKSQQEYKIAWEAESVKRGEVETKLLEIHQVLQDYIEDQEKSSLQATNATMKKHISELECTIYQLNQKTNELSLEIELINHSIRNFRGILQLVYRRFVNKIKPSNKKEPK